MDDDLIFLILPGLQQNQYMKARSGSAPRLQEVYTPRVKDGRIANEQPQNHYYGKTTQKLSISRNPNHVFNPQASPQKQKNNNKVQQKEAQQIVEFKLNVQAKPVESRQPKHNNIQNKKPQKKGNKQMTYYGRNLQYPAEQKHANLNSKPQQNDQIDLKITQFGELTKSASFSSTAFVDRASKTSQIKNRKTEFDQKFKVAFGYLLDNNEAYIKQRLRACNQKARPKDEIFKVLRPYQSTTNNDEYPEKNAPYEQHMQPQNLLTANSFGPRKVCGNSTSNQFHNGRQGPRADLAKWPQGFKLQGPLDGTTTYANKFPNHGSFDKMVPIAKFNEHPMGFPHKTNSTSRTYHDGKHVDPSKLAKWNNLHPYGNDFDPNRGTTYGENHSSKEKQPIQIWPMHQTQLIQSQGKFITEYNAELINPHFHQLNCANYCHCGRKFNQH